jgi:hypothetical protein
VAAVLRLKKLDFLESFVRASGSLEDHTLRVVPAYRSSFDIPNRIHGVLVHGIVDV